MSDIDFDELDKAVNTLMSDVPKVEPSKTDDTKTLTINSTLPDDARPSLARLDSTLSAVNGTVIAPVVTPAIVTPNRTLTPSLATRRGGRFMDVVHPSSDMKAAVKSPAVSSRQGVTIEPVNKLLPRKSDDQSDLDTTTVVIAPNTYKDLTVSDVAVQPSDVVSSPPEQDNASQGSSTDWPDPLDMSGYGAEPDTQNVASIVESTNEVKDENTADPESVEVSTSAADGLDYEDSESLTSPFITDAKVEKRPLGGAPVDAATEELGHAPVLGALAIQDDATTTDPADQLPATPATIEAQLPPELRSDLMAIETDGGTMSSRPPAVEPVVVSAESQPIVGVRTASVPATGVQSSVASSPTTGPTSIPQQYQEAPSTSDESNGSIYDTESYHQPLAHPAKTKSGWLWIIWILLLLIVGGGGAVALYFIGII